MRAFLSEGDLTSTFSPCLFLTLRSLPSAIDQPELTRLLSEHLSEHTEVKNIKVVRDSKGGVCAFVQCEV
jgi:hypothetical protein